MAEGKRTLLTKNNPMKKPKVLNNRIKKGFSLAEILAALVIGSMVIVSVLGIYNRARSSVSAIRNRLDETRMPREVLQRITEDLDTITGQNQGVTIKLESKTNEDGYKTGRLEIVKGYYNNEGEKQLLERIIWQSSYDIESDQPGLVLYRSHTGPAAKDPVFEKWRADWEEDFNFIPMCEGVTCFTVQAVQGKQLIDEWKKDTLPNGVKITVSFAAPQQTMSGEWEIPESERASQIIAIDKTRKIKFDIFKEEDNEEENSQR